MKDTAVEKDSVTERNDVETEEVSFCIPFIFLNFLFAKHVLVMPTTPLFTPSTVHVKRGYYILTNVVLLYLLCLLGV